MPRATNTHNSHNHNSRNNRRARVRAPQLQYALHPDTTRDVALVFPLADVLRPPSATATVTASVSDASTSGPSSDDAYDPAVGDAPAHRRPSPEETTGESGDMPTTATTTSGPHDDAAAASSLALPVLCPSCLPVSDPAHTTACPAHAESPACPLLHARLNRAKSSAIHRRDSPAVRAIVDRLSTEGASDEAPVFVGLPNHPDDTEPLRPSQCLPTQADMIADPPSSRGGIRACHCAHWLQRGVCVYGESCRFVHSLVPSALAAAQLDKQRRDGGGKSTRSAKKAKSAPAKALHPPPASQQPPLSVKVVPRPDSGGGVAARPGVSAPPQQLQPPSSAAAAAVSPPLPWPGMVGPPIYPPFGPPPAGIGALPMPPPPPPPPGFGPPVPMMPGGASGFIPPPTPPTGMPWPPTHPNAHAFYPTFPPR